MISSALQLRWYKFTAPCFAAQKSIVNNCSRLLVGLLRWHPGSVFCWGCWPSRSPSSFAAPVAFECSLANDGPPRVPELVGRGEWGKMGGGREYVK